MAATVFRMKFVSCLVCRCMRNVTGSNSSPCWQTRQQTNKLLLVGNRSFSQTSSGDSSDSNHSDEETKIELAKPGQAVKAKSKALRQSAQRDDEAKDEDLVSALDKVTKTFPLKHQQKTRSELLKKLQQHLPSSDQQQQSPTLSSLFAGMRVETQSDMPKGRKLDEKPRRQFREDDDEFRPRRTGMQPRQAPRKTFDEITEPIRRQQPVDQSSKLFAGPRLGIFTPLRQSEADQQRQQDDQATLFDQLEQDELKRLVTMPPENSFDEMIRWTKEGKLWKFPIDNEQGLDNEAATSFHEHVFIEQLVDDRFPSRGPVRHFMELVATGLSKNPYLSAAEKREHIDWYADYFEDKYHLIEEAMQAAVSSNEQTAEL